MIKTILFDFDGVILDSMKIKAEGFKSIFSEFSKDDIDKMEAFHYANGGVSRFEKIKYFFNVILQQNIEAKEIQNYAEKFAKAIEENLKKPDNLIVETVQFIQLNYQKFNMHIVSGAEHHELNELCEIFNLKKYFLSIEGSPVKKDVLIRNLLKNYNYNTQDTILIGDSINDYDAAQKNDIEFYAYNNIALKNLDCKYIDSFNRVHFKDEEAAE